MLNISTEKLNKKVDLSKYKAYKNLKASENYPKFNLFLKIFTVIAIIAMFLPWTQNVTGKGYVTTLSPTSRPQNIQSAIPGRIEKWYIREGDFVDKGDTLMFISEIKNAYQDPNLVTRVEQQRNAKNSSVNAYQDKINALANQIRALKQEQGLKLNQAKNKLQQAQLLVKSDSIELEAAKTNFTIAERQFQRIESLHQEGLKSLTDLETKRVKFQETQAKLIGKKNKLLSSKNKVINANIEITRTRTEYNNKIAKATSDRSTAQSSRFESEAQVAKLENTLSNYQIRSGLHYITAPQSGYVNQALIEGIGATFKEGEKLMTIMPIENDLGVETFINPMDLPLIHKGEKVRLQFDGWPAIFFSGWPNTAYGTFGGEIVAVERSVNKNGKFRVLIAPDKDNNHVWPKNLRAGAGAYAFALLNDVPIWYEIWRKLNGFPPNYYTPETKKVNKIEKSKFKIKVK